MKTRRSNRAKRYTFENLEFESGSEGAVPAARRRNVVEERDEDFDDAAREADVFDVEEAGRDAAVLQRDAVEEEGSRKTSRRPKATRVPTIKEEVVSEYREIEPVPSDSHAVRSYAGPYNRAVRGRSLIQTWYGPRQADVETMQRVLNRWIGWTVLPPKLHLPDDDLGLRAVWSPGFFRREASFAERWLKRVHGKHFSVREQCRSLSAEEAAPYQLPARSLPVLLGPSSAQKEVLFSPGDAQSLSQAWIPFDLDASEGKIPTGWMLDAGGIVLGMDWAHRPGGVETSQLLAIAVVPHADQTDYSYDYEIEHQKPGFQKHGTVQIWEFCGVGTDGVLRPSEERPKLQKTLCLDAGRARRVKWSPGCDILAILSAGGDIFVMEYVDGGCKAFEKVEQPLARISLSADDGIKASAMDWVTLNRLAVGYADGSAGLWSIQPLRLLLRHPVHHCEVVDIATGYPSIPYLVASSPLGGAVKLVDLRAPSYESTEVQVNAVNWQPNLLAWSDHTLGFVSSYPSATALNTLIGFMHHRHFPLVRRIFTSDCFLSCLAVGRTHPFLLIGASDGSLWCMNPQVKLFKGRLFPIERLRLFQHEFRPSQFFTPGSPAATFGASRFLHGFPVEENRPAVSETPAQKEKKSKRAGDGEDGGGDDESASLTDPARAVMHELQSRVSIVVWNPNEAFGCWAATAVGSGLVRVIDLGLDVESSDD